MQQVKKNPYDIREHKNTLRNKFKEIRLNFSKEEKENLDEKIFEKVINSKFYQECDVVFLFVSTKIEVDTIKLINFSLENGKKVAVPKCVDGTRNMDFYYINSVEELEVATFSVLEPIVNICEKVLKVPTKSICIVPGLSFDKEGYRLGYGKGYYDRFLSNFKGITLGICYCACFFGTLPHGRFDKKVDYLVTEKFIKSFLLK